MFGLFFTVAAFLLALAFPRTAADRVRTNDPRASIEERYGDRTRYLERVRAAAERLVRERHALAEDVEAMVTRAGTLWDHLHATS